jgi:peptide deformylase
MKQILINPNPKLRTPAKKIAEISSAVIKLATEMTEIMRKAPGIGLAATQIGEDRRVIVMEIEKKLYKWANPQIKKRSAKLVLWEEGCLSVPGLVGPVLRPEKIEYEAIDIETGKKIKGKASGLLARVIQHEIDHLDGILYIDRVADKSLLKKSNESKI